MGLSKLEDLVDLAKENGMPALAITDHGNMYGAIEFYKLAKKAGIKPIIGVEAYMTDRLDRTKTTGSWRNKTILSPHSAGKKFTGLQKFNAIGDYFQSGRILLQTANG